MTFEFGQCVIQVGPSCIRNGPDHALIRWINHRLSAPTTPLAPDMQFKLWVFVISNTPTSHPRATLAASPCATRAMDHRYSQAHISRQSKAPRSKFPLRVRALLFAMVGSLAKYRTIEAAIVARAMLAVAAAPISGVTVYEFDRMTSLGTVRRNDG
jgi:hypothetical protein